MLLDTPTVTGRVDTRILRAEDLSLTDAEIRKWLEGCGSHQGSDDDALLQAVDGWPVFVADIAKRGSDATSADGPIQELTESLSAARVRRRIARLLMLRQGM